MKVKVMEIETSWGIGTVVMGHKDRVESALREWLDDNPNASIEHVAQIPLSSNTRAPGVTTSMLVTIFYRD